MRWPRSIVADGRRPWAVTLAVSGLYFSFAFAWNAIAALITTIAPALAFSGVETGVVLGAVPFVILFTWPVMGPLVDRVGPDVAMGVGVIVVGLAGVGRAMLSSALGLALAMAVLGLAGSTVTYGFPRVISSWFPGGETGRPLGVATIGASLGIVTSFATLEPLVQVWGVDWRLAFGATGVPALVLGTAWLLFGGYGEYHEPGEAPSLRDVRSLLARPDVALLVLAGVMYLFSTHTIRGWLAPLLIERGLGKLAASQTLTVFTVGNVVGSLAVPAASDRAGSRAPFVGAAGLTVVACMGGYALLPASLPLALAASLVLGVAIGGVSPMLRVLPVEWVAQSSVSTVVSMVFGLGSIGGFLGPVLVGYLDSVGYPPAVSFLALAVPGVAFVAIALAASRAIEPG